MARVSRHVRAAYRLASGTKLPASHRNVLGFIAAHMNRDGWAWPGEDLMAFTFDLHGDTVGRAVVALERAGLIEVHRRPGRVNLYRIPGLDNVDALSTTPRAHAGGSTVQPPAPASGTPRAHAGGPPAPTRGEVLRKDERKGVFLPGSGWIEEAS